MQNLCVTNKRGYMNNHEKYHICKESKREIGLMTKIPNIERLHKYQTLLVILHIYIVHCMTLEKAQQLYRFMNINEKFYEANTQTWCNKLCRQGQITANYILI